MTNTKTLDLLEMPMKTGSAKAMKSAASDNYLQRISTSKILWHVVKRHKFGLVATWAVIITISYMFPPFWDILGSLVS